MTKKTEAAKQLDAAPVEMYLYAGKRFDGSKQTVAFYKMDGAERAGAQSRWTVDRSVPLRRLIIGHYYEMKCDDGTAWFHTLKASETFPDPADEFSVTKWSAMNQAATTAKQTFDARKRIQRETVNRWRDALAPMRSAYSAMSVAERRAFRELITEMLQGGE